MKTENIKKYRKEYYQKNKEKINAAHTKWCNNNKEKQAEYALAWQRKNKKRLSEYKKKYAKENPEKVASWIRNSRIKKGLCPDPKPFIPMTPAEIKIRHKEYRTKNKEMLLERARKRYHSSPEHREKRRIYEAEWRKNNKEKIRGYYQNKK